jgi:hypothetical protein
LSITQLAVALVAAAILAPAASALVTGPHVNPLMNGDFDMETSQPALDPVRPFVDQCLGIGHQAMDPLYSSWGDWAISTANDPANSTPEEAAAANAYWQGVAEGYAADPGTVYGCNGVDTALVNPSEKIVDPGFQWSNDPGTTFGDFDGDGDREARIPRVPAEHTHNLWQSVATPTQAFSADFDLFAFRVESGVVPASANIQVGLSLSPGYQQHPFVGAFWEGAILFRSTLCEAARSSARPHTRRASSSARTTMRPTPRASTRSWAKRASCRRPSTSSPAASGTSSSMTSSTTARNRPERLRRTRLEKGWIDPARRRGRVARRRPKPTSHS